MHLEFCCKLYLPQQSLGRDYLQEHPSAATSWKVECMAKMQQSLGAIRVRADQCQYGVTTVKKGVTYPAMKPADFLTNSVRGSKSLVRRCPGNHVHAHLDEGTAKAAETYPPALVIAIITGLKNQIEYDKDHTVKTKAPNSLQLQKNLVDYGCPTHWVDRQHEDTVDDGIMRNELNALRVKYGEPWAVDEFTGKVLDTVAIKEARALEMAYFHNMKEYTEVPTSISRGKKVIKTRWIDINKGDEASPDL